MSAPASNSLGQVLGGAVSLTSDYGWTVVVAAALLAGLWGAARAARLQAPPRASAHPRRALLLWLAAWIVVSLGCAGLGTWALRRTPVDVRLDLEKPLDGRPEILVADRSGEKKALAFAMEPLDNRFGIPYRPFIEILATGRRSAPSVGGQAWIDKFAYKDRLVQDPPGTWATNAGGMVGTLAPEPTRIRWEGTFERNPRIGLIQLPWGGIVKVTTAEGTQAVDLYAESRATLWLDIPPRVRTAAYVAQVPRSGLRSLAIRFPERSTPRVVRFYAATLVPTIVTPLERVPDADWGRVRTGLSTRWRNGVLPLGELPAIEWGGWATLALLFGISLVVAGIALGALREALRVGRAMWAMPLPNRAVAPWRWRRYAAFWLAAALYWGFWLLVFYPGTVTPDALDQWNQAKTGVYSDHHPAPLAFGIAVLTRVWDSPAPVVLAQIVLMASALALAADFLWRAGVRRWLVLLLYAVTLLSPKNGDLAVSLVKDVPYAAGTLAICAVLAELLVSPALRRRAWPWVALGLLLGACRLVRHNGSALVFVTLVLALWAFRSHWRRVALAAVCALALVGAVRGGLYRLMGVRMPVKPNVLMTCIVSRLGAVVDQHPALTEREFELLDSARALDDAWDYDPVWMCPIFYYAPPHDFHPVTVFEHLREYESMLATAAVRYPGVLWRHTVRSQDYLFCPPAVQSRALESFIGATPSDLPYARSWGLKTEPLLPGVYRSWSHQLWQWSEPAWSWLVWRPALAVYACLIAFIVAVWRTRDARFSLVFLAPLVVLPTLLATFTQCVRYVLPVTFAAPFLVGLACLPARRREGEPANEEPDEPAEAAPVARPWRARFRLWCRPSRRTVVVATVVVLALALPSFLLARRIGRTHVGVFLDLADEPARPPAVRHGGASDPMAPVPSRYVAGLRPWCELQVTGEKNPASTGTGAAVWDLPDTMKMESAPANAARRTGKVVNVGGGKPATVRWTGVYERGVVARLQQGPYAGIVVLRTAAGEERIDLYAPTVGYVSRPVPAGEPLHRYFALVPRRALAALAFDLADASHVAGLNVSTLVPSEWYPLSPVKPPHARGRQLSESAAPVVANGTLTLGPLSPLERGGWLTFAAVWFVLSAAALAVALALAAARHVWRALRASDAPAQPRTLRPAPRWLTAAFFVPPLVVWGFALLVFYPAAMQSDALDQWNQAHTMQINDWHPAFHTLAIRLLTLAWDSPAIVVIAQGLLMAGFLAAGFSLLWRAGVPRKVVVAAYLACLLSPKNFTMVPNIVKDVPFACVTGLMAVVLARGVLDDAARTRARHALGLGLLLGLAPLLRHNGAALSAVVLAALLVAWPRAWRAAAGAAIAALLVVTVVRAGVYPALQVAPRAPFQDGLVSACTASLLDAGVPMSPDEYTFLDQVRPVIDGRWPYSPVTMGDFFHGAAYPYQKDFAVAHLPEYRRLLVHWAVRAPLLFARHFARNTAYLWVPWQIEADRVETYTPRIVPEQALAQRYGLRPESFFPRLHHMLLVFHWRSHVPSINWLLWYPGLHLWIALVAAAVAVRRTGEWRLLLVYLPFVLNTASLALIWSQCMRYQYPLTLATAFLVALAFVPTRTVEGR